MGRLWPNIHVVCRKFLQLPSHNKEANNGVIDGVEGESAALGKLVDVAIEPIREISPMQSGVNVVTNVIAVIVSQLVHVGINNVVREVERVLVILGIHEDMLREISEH
jgi:hypothetical protein